MKAQSAEHLILPIEINGFKPVITRVDTMLLSCIPPPVNRCPCQNAQKGTQIFDNCGGAFMLTLFCKSGKVRKTNAMTKNSTRIHLSSENCRLVQGSRKVAPNTFLSGSAEQFSRWRRVRPILRLRSVGTGMRLRIRGKLRWYHGVNSSSAECRGRMRRAVWRRSIPKNCGFLCRFLQWLRYRAGQRAHPPLRR